jgi:hypothetical protein
MSKTVFLENLGHFYFPQHLRGAAFAQAAVFRLGADVVQFAQEPV